jgi:hypothetical protein
MRLTTPTLPLGRVARRNQGPTRLYGFASACRVCILDADSPDTVANCLWYIQP